MGPLDLVARFVRPLFAWVEATPIHVLLVCFVLLVVFGLACVWLPLCSPSIVCLFDALEIT